MNTAIVLMETGKATLPKAVYTDWDWATLICAKHNQEKVAGQGFYLVEIPFDATSYPISFEVIRQNSEIFIRDWENNEMIGEIVLEKDYYEERFHEAVFPVTKLTYNVKYVKICDTLLDELKISNELKRLINNEAEKYRDEMIEQIGQTDE